MPASMLGGRPHAAAKFFSGLWVDNRKHVAYRGDDDEDLIFKTKVQRRREKAAANKKALVPS